MRHLTLRLPSPLRLEMEAPDHLFIPRVLERDGLPNYERDTLAASLAVLSLCDGPFVDVGANVGVFSLLAAAVLGRQCYAFEPLPDAVQVLRSVVEKHQLPIEVSTVALSDRAGTADFYISSQTDSSSGLNRRFRKPQTSFVATLDRLDDIVGNKRPALIKIDTETTEPAVLAGARQTIAQHAPYLIVEVLRGRTEKQLQEYFDGRGYHWYHLTDVEHWPEASELAGDPNYKHNNWLFAPEPLGGRFFDELRRWREALSNPGMAMSVPDANAPAR